MNIGQYGNEYAGNDLRVEQAWLQGVTGCNVTVTIVDDGIIVSTAQICCEALLLFSLGMDFQHPDLWPNFVCYLSQKVVHGFLTFV